MQIIGNFNKIPVQRIVDGVVASLDNPDIDLHQFNFLKRFATAASDRGSMIIMDEKILPGDILFIEVEDSILTAYQFIFVDNIWWLKVWEQSGTQTTETTYSNFRPESFATIEDLKKALKNAKPDESQVEVGDVLIIENQNGILIPAKATIIRLGELMDLVQKTASESSLRWFLPGWVGDTSMLDGAEMFMPVPSDVDPKSAANPAFSDMLFKEIAMLLPFYFQTTSSYTLMPRESGISRYLNMQGYINRVKLTQRLSAFVMQELFDVKLTFTNLIFNLTLETAEGNTGGSIASVESQSQDVV